MRFSIMMLRNIAILIINSLLIFNANLSAVNGKDFNNEKIRVCVVEGRGSYRKTEKFCPILEQQTNIECVIGLDQSDCIRRIHKGSAHFGVFSSEDLIAARWASIEVLVTSEMRFHDHPFEYEIVAVVDNEAGIHTAQDLRGSKLCHPGQGLEGHWTEVLANYLENTLVPKSCDPELSLMEARIKSSANFFGPSCKAGPWVPDPLQDRTLKNRYRSLCELCYDSYRCGIGDKHWGRRGTLYCLTSGAGEVSWARLDDVRSHFGFSGLQAEANPNEYSFLCPDGHLQPLSEKNPCVWVAKPWPAIAAKRSHASIIQDLASKLSHDGKPWQNALLSLLETYHVNINTLDTTIPIDDYLDQAIGFQSAYSFPECNPPRSIIYCTTEIIQHVKCSWLQEVSQAYGIEPNIQCIRTESLERCLDDTRHQVADVILVDQDNRIKAQRDYNLLPLLFEHSKELHDRYVTVAVVKKNSPFKTFEDIQNEIACFPSYEGAAYLSVQETLMNRTANNPVNVEKYFSDKSCFGKNSRKSHCPEKYFGDEGALRCLLENHGNVAFLSLEIYENFTNGILNSTWISRTRDLSKIELQTLCPYGQSNTKYFKYKSCYLHWTPRGHLMVHNSTLLRRTEIHSSLSDMDKLFGKQTVSHNSRSFSLYGPFDRRNNVLFRDKTDSLKPYGDLRKDAAPRLMESVYHRYVNKLYPSSSSKSSINSILLILLSVLLHFRFNNYR